MFIRTEETPNPQTLKFIPGRTVMADGVREFATPEEAAESPLAEALFDVEGVSRVFFGPDFLTVTKGSDEVDWRNIQASILAAIMDWDASGEPLFTGQPPQGGSSGHAEDAYEGDAAQIVAEIKDLLDTRIRPAVAQDGGDILFSRFEPDTGIVWLHMRGACAGCPSSTATLKAGVENMLRHYVPEVSRVEQTV
jgi:NFU1 iron-sulfur cluster scaffold homolog, mitochondrial